MNDLNSIYLVGKVKKISLKTKKDGQVEVNGTIVNNNYVYDKTKKEYIQKETVIPFSMKGENPSMKIFSEKVKKGSRIGINGRLVTNKEKLNVVCFTVEPLDK